MNRDSLSFALSQISYAVANISKKNYKSSVQEINHLVAQHGLETDRHLLRCLFSHVDFSGDGRSSGKDFHQIQYLVQECSSLITKPSFISNLCYAIDNPFSQQKTLKPTNHLFQQLTRVLKLTKVQEIVFALALQHSSRQETVHIATAFIRNKLPELIKIYIEINTNYPQAGGLHDTSPEILHLILVNLLNGPKDKLGVSSEQKQAFLVTLQKDFPRDRVPAVLAPLLYPDAIDIPMYKITQETTTAVMAKTMMEGSLPEFIAELGYGFCVSVEECRESLVQFGIREINPASIARVLSMMTRTHTGLTDHVTLENLQNSSSSVWSENKGKGDGTQLTTWNSDIFVQAVSGVISNFNWREVVSELDNPTFLLKDRQGLNVLSTAFQRAFSHDMFPIEILYRHWKNQEGQLSFIIQSLKNSDLFCFADYPCHSVQVDNLKSLPEDDNRDVSTWKSMQLVSLLIYFSEAGYYNQVQELLKFPVQNCPDILIMALLQMNQPLNLLAQELLKTMMPLFLGNHPNSTIVLHYAWHAQNQPTTVRNIVVHAMSDWYMCGENDNQSRLSRVLEIAQDLKALSNLLGVPPFIFMIDLACLAARREYLKLDKWLAEKIREHGEAFIQECVNFLKRRCPQIMGGVVKDDSLPKNAQLQPETLANMLSCLQGCTGNVSPDLSETILNMISNCGPFLTKPRQPPPGVVKPPSRGLDSTPFIVGSLGNSLLQNQLDIANITANMAQLGLGSMALGSMGQGSTSSSSNTISSFDRAMIGSVGNSASAFSVTSSSPAKQLFAPSNIGSSSSGLGGLSQTAFSSLLPSQLQSQLGLAGLGSSALGNIGSKVPPLGGSFGSIQSTTGSSTSEERLRQTFSQENMISGDMSSILGDLNAPVTKEVIEEADSYFQRVYTSVRLDSTIDEVLDMLKRFQVSPIKKERDVFACMIKNLFQEYRFFPQYPDKELLITAKLFGGIIEHSLITFMLLGFALRSVLDALRRPYGSQMFMFGITALERFKGRLKEYPQYCQHLMAISHFKDFPQDLIEYMEYGARSEEPPNKPPTSVGTSLWGTQQGMLSSGTTSFGQLGLGAAGSIPATTTAKTITSTTSTATTTIAKPVATLTGKPSIANATNIDTLLVATEKDEKLVVPSETIQDKVAFIFNNLSQANLSQKTEEFKEVVQSEHLTWASQYLVMKRASIEPNFHLLYANFVDTLQVPEFNKLVVRETYRNIKVLLRSDKGIANFSDRSLLKNLGHWLGMITMAKNKPILQNDIDIKGLLMEAYRKGQQELLYVVPFLAKILESCSKSKVFKMPNPWTSMILCLLAELHQEPDLKLNLKFEIEVLCKNLTIDINDLKPRGELKAPEKPAVVEQQLSQIQKKPSITDTVTVSATAPSLHPSQSAVTSVTQSLPQTAVLPAKIPMPGAMEGLRLGDDAEGAASAAGGVQPVLPEPGFSFLDFNTSLGIVPYLKASTKNPLLNAQPALKKFVVPAIERAVQECIILTVDRSVKIALTTCEQIARKDFSLDPEENRMRASAHHMVRNLTAGTVLFACRDPLVMAITNNLKNAFLTSLRSATPQQKEMLEQAAGAVAQENVEAACAFIQKTAVEKAIPEIDKRLNSDFELRKHARKEGRRYCDSAVLTYQAERMPEQIRLKVGGVTQQQLSVYEEFSRCIPGFMPINDPSALALLAKPATNYATDEITQIYDKIAAEIERYIQSSMTSAADPQIIGLHSLLEAILLARNTRDILGAVTLLQKAVEGLLDGLSRPPTDLELAAHYRDAHILTLKALQDPRAYGPQWTNKHVTRCLTECRQEEYKYNLKAVDCLIRSNLVNLQQYDLHLAQNMENGMNYMAVVFGMQLLRVYLVEDRERSSTFLSDASFFNTIEILTRISQTSRQPPDGLHQLIEIIRSNNDGGLLERVPGGPSAMMHSGISQARQQFDDPPGLQEKTEMLLREWVNMYHSPHAGKDSTKAFSSFVHQMDLHGILKTDDLITRFFRLCTEMCVQLCYRALGDQTSSQTMVRTKCYHTLDAYVRLVTLLVKFSGDNTNHLTKVNLLSKVLGIITGVLLHDHDVRGTDFQQLPYHRMFIMLLLELCAPEPVLESINFQVLTAFCNTLHILRPAKAPGFAFAWIEIISHRVFIGRMLAVTLQQKCWSMYAQLLVDLFRFLSPFLRNAELAKSVAFLYKGTLRVLLVLLHDFPEFLCDYHYGLCDVIPPNCIQMRNLVLSAFPRNMRLPDPFTPNLKVDMLPEISMAPRVLTNFAAMIQPPNFKKDMDSYIKTRAPVTFLSELRSNLQVSSEPGAHYNIPLINALVLYVGTQAIEYIHSKGLTSSIATITHSSHMDIFQNLAVDLDTEGRYLFFNAIANQLRYPNSHTHYFSCTLLYLFAEANTEAIQEQITRVLLERLIVNRPHPWGLLITFIELIKNPLFKFWSHEFVHCATEIEKLFESVARSCAVAKQPSLGREQDVHD